MALTIEEITAVNLTAMDEVYNGILQDIANGNTGTPPIETSRFSEIPHFKSLVAQRNHDILCFPSEGKI